MLDGWGGIHPFAVGSNPLPAKTRRPYWKGWDIARGLVLNAQGTGGYVLDGWGGIHRFAVGSSPLPQPATGGAYWKGHDVARGLALNPQGSGGYVVDSSSGSTPSRSRPRHHRLRRRPRRHPRRRRPPNAWCRRSSG